MSDTEPVIVGIGRTRYTRRSAVSEHGLAVQAINAALRDARLTAAQLDGVVRFDRDAVWEYDLPGVRGLRTLTFYNAVPFSAGSAPALVRMAAMAISTGLAEVVIGYHARNPAERSLAMTARLAGGEQFQVPFGITSLVHQAALLVQRYGLDEHAIAAVTVAARRAAARNLGAVQRRALTLVEYRRSPLVATPLRAVDCAVPSAGAAAFVMTTRKRAVPTQRPLVRVLASMQCGLPSTARQLCDWFRADRARALPTAARELFRTARCRPTDVDLAYLWNGISAVALLGLEQYGFCSRGQSAAFVRDGGLRRLRLNPNGGQLAEADLDGINDLVDAIERLRDGDARTALVAGSPLEPTSAVLLGRV